MGRRPLRIILPYLNILLLAVFSGVCIYQSVVYADERHTQPDTPVAEWITSGTDYAYRTVNKNTDAKEAGEDIENNTSDGLFFQHYITPEDELIKSMAASLNGIEDAYRESAGWVYVSDETLHGVADRWLSPHEFLTGTSHYPENPLSGEIVSDCEEQANTLVSLLRAWGVDAEQVRVVLGSAAFNGVERGHAWVQILIDNRWVALDPIWGPYWDNQEDCLVDRQRMPFNHFIYENYPAQQVWIYYNDIYYLNPVSDSGNAPSSWYTTALFSGLSS